MAYFLGIDGGGNQTNCLLADETGVLGMGSSGASNVIRVGEVAAAASIRQAIEQAVEISGIAPGAIARTCLGAAGADRSSVAESLKQIVSTIVGGEVQVCGDMVISLHAAFGGGPGIIVIGGTGSLAYGRNQEGKTARAGGWGFAISDEGSGHWIGRHSVGAVMRAHDEREPTQLTEGILKAWNLGSLDALVPFANSPSGVDFSALLPVVMAAAEAGDPVARTLLTQAGTELAALAKIVIARRFGEALSIPVAMIGGVFRHSALVRQVFYNSLRSEYSNATVNPAVVDPVRGALELARNPA